MICSFILTHPVVRQLADFALLFMKLLFIHKSGQNLLLSGLKGQYNIAQGIPKLRDGRNDPKRRRSAELTSKPWVWNAREKPSALPAAGGGNSMNKVNNSLRTPACRRQGIAELHFGKYETIIFVRK